MAVEFDTIGTGNRVTGTDTISWSHTRATPGGNHVVLVVVAVSGATTVGYDDESITKTATIGGRSMLYVGGVNVNNATMNAGWLYYFILGNPPKDTSTVTVTISKSGFTPSSIIGNSVGYYNSASRGPLLFAASSTFSGLTVTEDNAPAGERQIIAIASSNSLIQFTGPAEVRNLYGTGGSVTGTADYLNIADIVAPSGGYSLTGNNGGNWGCLLLGLNEAAPLAYAQEQLTSYTDAGAYVYDIPSWATHIDIVLLGGGGGGGASSATRGSGGYAGTWAAVTLERGVDIPISTTQITGTVGVGGAGGNSNGGSGASGGDTTATASSWTGLATAGGVGGPGSSTSRQQAGFDAGNYTYNGIIHVGGTGGATTAGAGQSGNPPGGGGAGGSFVIFNWRRGGDGAPGAAFFYAYSKGGHFFNMF